jgi:predicted alpha/beta hydrolase family esterase
MKTAIIIHGYSDKDEYLDHSRPSPSNDHWIPWIQRQLQLQEILAQAPDMPGFYQPNYDTWKEMLERFPLDEETILVGHSCGGGFLVRYLSENNVKVGKVVLVAPWLDPNQEIDPEFFDFKIDKNIANKTAGIVTMYSTDDMEEILVSVKTIKDQTQGIEFQEFANKGHFVLGSLNSNELPELLDHLLQ